ncbi:hypothetical protein Gotur_008386 [Gossypium turneri]
MSSNTKKNSKKAEQGMKEKRQQKEKQGGKMAKKENDKNPLATVGNRMWKEGGKSERRILQATNFLISIARTVTVADPSPLASEAIAMVESGWWSNYSNNASERCQWPVERLVSCEVDNKQYQSCSQDICGPAAAFSS